MNGLTAFCQIITWKGGTEGDRCLNKIKINKNLITPSLVPPIQTKLIITKGDSAALQHYWQETDKHVLKNLQPTSGTSVILPDGDILLETEKGAINISDKLTTKAQTAIILQNLDSLSLISLGQVCNDNCTIVLNSDSLYAAKTKDIAINVDKKRKMMKWTQNYTDGLYDIPVYQERINNNFVLPTLKNANMHKIYQQKKINIISMYKKSFLKPKTKQTVNTMNMTKFNNIITPVIKKQCKPDPISNNSFVKTQRNFKGKLKKGFSIVVSSFNDLDKSSKKQPLHNMARSYSWAYFQAFTSL